MKVSRYFHNRDIFIRNLQAKQQTGKKVNNKSPKFTQILAVQRFKCQTHNFIPIQCKKRLKTNFGEISNYPQSKRK